MKVSVPLVLVFLWVQSPAPIRIAALLLWILALCEKPRR